MGKLLGYATASPTPGVMVATIDSALPQFQIAPEMMPGMAAWLVSKRHGTSVAATVAAVTNGADRRTPVKFVTTLCCSRSQVTRADRSTSALFFTTGTEYFWQRRACCMQELPLPAIQVHKGRGTYRAPRRG